MTGTTADIIPIVIVPVVALAFMLVMVNYANNHPQWGSQAPADTVSTRPLESSVPAQRLSTPGPAVPGQRQGTAADEVTRADAGQPNPGELASASRWPGASPPAAGWDRGNARVTRRCHG